MADAKWMIDVLAVAAAAYDYVAEKQNPAPDPTMLRITWGRLEDVVNGLPVEVRRLLGAEAGR